IECRLLDSNFRWRAAESNLRCVEGAARDVDRVVPNHAVGVEIAAPGGSTGDIGVGEPRSTNIEKRQLRRQSPPGRTERAGRAHPVWLIEVRRAERECILASGSRSREAPVV